jgi:hypothetical protein
MAHNNTIFAQLLKPDSGQSCSAWLLKDGHTYQINGAGLRSPLKSLVYVYVDALRVLHAQARNAVNIGNIDKSREKNSSSFTH